MSRILYTLDKYVSLFHTSNDKSERTHKRCHAYVVVRNVQIPLKFRCRYITSSCALHLLTCMLVRSCWHKKSWSYFDNFNEVFNACFVCLFCLVNYKSLVNYKKKKKKKKKKKAMNSHYTIKESHPPTASQIQKIIFHRRLSSPESHSTSTPTREPSGPDQRHIIKLNRAGSASEEGFEEVCLFYVIPECFPGQNQIEILLNYALISINKTLSQTP